jgi:hypothetical protein
LQSCWEATSLGTHASIWLTILLLKLLVLLWRHFFSHKLLPISTDKLPGSACQVLGK